MERLLLFSTFLACLVSKGAVTEDIPSSSSGLQVIFVDAGANFSLPCGGGKVGEGDSVMWIHEERKDRGLNYRIQKDGSIFFPNMKKSDSGTYSCKFEDSSIEDAFQARVRIRVRTPPSQPRNVTTTPFTISAAVDWAFKEEEDGGGYPLRNFQIAYRLKSERDWKTCLPALIDPNLRQYKIYQLQPNSTYLIKVWANNKLGSGTPTIVETTTKNDPQEIELRKHFLDGVDSFDVRIWIIAVGIVTSTLIILGVAVCCLFYKEYSMSLGSDSRRDSDGESIELMPNIILNPGYDFQSMEITEPDENWNDTTALRMNNNSVINPSRV